MVESEKIVAVGLLTAREVRRWGQDLKHIYPVPEDGTFEDLLSAIRRATARPRR
jgi:hypothetical protein